MKTTIKTYFINRMRIRKASNLDSTGDQQRKSIVILHGKNKNISGQAKKRKMNNPSQFKVNNMEENDGSKEASQTRKTMAFSSSLSTKVGDFSDDLLRQSQSIHAISSNFEWDPCNYMPANDRQLIGRVSRMLDRDMQ